MKKLLLLFVLSISLFSCSDNSNDLNIQKSDILGTWNLTELKSNATLQLTYQGITENSNTIINGKNYDFTFTFTENPDEYTSEGTFTMVTTHEISGQTSTQETETTAVSGLDSGEWEIVSDKIIFNANGETIELTIISATENRLVLKQNINENQSINGATIKIEGTATIVLEK